MFFAELIRVVAGLAITLGLIGLCVVAMRRYGSQVLARLQGVRRERRMAVVETLVLDPARRLVLVRIDAEERLLLLGEGRMIAETTAASPRQGAGS